ncbi:MAG: alpha-mannosidase [Oscillibacter sp.]|nr:alpha-mannosidase [Oscillibacter sp.]
MDYMQDKIRVIVEQLDALRHAASEPLEGFTYCAAPYKTSNTPPEGPWLPWDPAASLEGWDAHYWFHRAFTAPAAEDGQNLFFQLTTGREGTWDGVNPQGLVYLNGEMIQGLDVNHQMVLLEPGKDYDLYVYMYTSMMPPDRMPEAGRFQASLVWVDTETEALYYDLKVPLDASQYVAHEGREYWQILKALDGAVRLLDLRGLDRESFRAGVTAAREYLRTEFYEKVCGGAAPVVHCVGHTHIDVAWLWSLAQTREKAQRSFATVLRLMEQYPEYIFMSSQPQLYQYVKESAPEIYEQIRQRVREGRWEVEGAMWLEADCNLTSGESLVRQILHGKQFMQREFGVDSRTLWLPDVFGYSAALPQILRKSGVDRFFTTKISWNETNKMPYDVFMWQGIDGTEIFTCFGTARDLPRPDQSDTCTTYVGNTEPRQIRGTWERFQQKECSDHTILTFGFGDGGGGPTPHHLEVQRRMAKGIPGLPRTEISTTDAYFARVTEDFQQRAETSRVPRWVGELYLEFHRGTYTSIAKNKRNNRKSEFLYQKAETLSVLSNLFCETPYPKDSLYAGWETILLNQFHDIIPGSSIHQVYEVSDRQYADIQTKGGQMSETALRALAGKVPGEGFLVYNPLGFVRSGLVDCGGKSCWVEDVPAMGWKAVRPGEAGSDVTISAHTLENDCCRLELDNAGEISSLFDKRAGRELCRSGQKLNMLQVFEDFPRDYDAWELSLYYKDKMWPVNQVKSVETVDDCARRGIKVVKTYGASEITQTIWLYDHSPRIDFETEVEWHQRHQILKAVFPMDLHTTQASYEIQFGHVYRPTHSNTSWDAAKFEVCAHKWADLSENGYGVSLLNDCKYGHSADGSTLTLSLLKSATYPDPEADQGRHVFTYSLLPHTGDFRESGTIQESYCLNQPLMAAPLSGNGTGLPETFSLVHCDQPNVILETVKQAEDGGDLILRFYEAYDRRVRARLTLGIPFAGAEVCDLMENPVPDAEITVNGQEITLPVRNFEIVTLRIRR